MEIIGKYSNLTWAENLKMIHQKLMNLILEKFLEELSKNINQVMMKKLINIRHQRQIDWMQKLLHRKIRWRQITNQVKGMSPYELNQWKLNPQEPNLLNKLDNLLIQTLGEVWQIQGRYQGEVKSHMQMELFQKILRIIQVKILFRVKYVEELLMLIDFQNMKKHVKK